MKAYIVDTMNKNIKLADIDLPTIEDGEVLVKVINWSICRTDISHVKNKLGVNADGKVTGHEVIGKIVESKDSRFQTDDCIVYMGGTDFGGAAEYRKLRCVLTNDPNSGEKGSSTEWVFTDRYFYDTVGAAVVKLDDKIDHIVRYGSLLEPLCCVLRATEKNKPNSGSNIIILGGGAIGSLAYQCFRFIYGANKIIVLDIDENKLDHLNNSYLDKNLETILIESDSGQERIAEIINKSKGAYCQYLFDALPPNSFENSSLDTRELGARFLAPNGQYILFSASNSPETTNLFWLILAKGINITSAGFDQRVFPMNETAKILEMAYGFARSGLIDLSKIVTKTISFYDESEVQFAYKSYGKPSHLLKTIVCLDKSKIENHV